MDALGIHQSRRRQTLSSVLPDAQLHAANPESAQLAQIHRGCLAPGCFHELGHSIHWPTSRSAYGRFHQNTPRDFLEIPSRMLEHLFYDANVIRSVSCHWEHPDKDVKIPEDAIEKLTATRYENVASSKLGDLVLAHSDMAAHTTWDPAEDISVLHNRIRRKISLLHGPEDLGLGYGTLHGETHARYIHGYGASNYSYLL